MEGMQFKVAVRTPAPSVEINNKRPLSQQFRTCDRLSKVIVELKSVEKFAPARSKQLLTHLRLTDKKLGLLVNFGEALIKDGIKRVVNGLAEGPRQDAKTRK